MEVNTIEQLLKDLDWDMLWQQKQWLIKQKTDEAKGLMHLLDDLQDVAVETYGYEENKVFPWKDEEVENGG